MRTPKLVVEIDRAIKEGRLDQPFRAADVRAACSNFAYNTYNTFLPKHEKNKARDNKVKAYFERVGDGLYRRCYN